MAIQARLRPFVSFVAAAVLVLSFCAAQAQAPISVAPKTVKAGTSPTLTISSAGLVDLSRLRASQIDISPRDGISNIRVSDATPQRLTLSFSLAGTAAAGPLTIALKADDDLTVSLRFVVEAADIQLCSPANCRPPRACNGDVCAMPVCTADNCRPPRDCFNGVCRPAKTCRPACRFPKPVCDDGVCILPR